MQRAAAKGHDIKLSKQNKVNLRNFTKERIQDFKKEAMARHRSQKMFGGARSPDEIN